MICLVRVTGAGRYWARTRRLAQGALLANVLAAAGIALALRGLR